MHHPPLTPVPCPPLPANLLPIGWREAWKDKGKTYSAVFTVFSLASDELCTSFSARISSRNSSSTSCCIRASSSWQPQPPPASAPHASARLPARVVDEDYDEGVTDALMGLASFRAPEMSAPSGDGAAHSPSTSSRSRHTPPSPHHGNSHRGSVSTTRGHASPPPGSPTAMHDTLLLY